MKVLVDTPIWSLALRRKSRHHAAETNSELTTLIADGRVAIIGPIRQELLSGVKDRPHFDRLRDQLQAFPDVEITSTDYEEAASFFNQCRGKGIQGSNTDLLICAIAVRHQLPIFTTDGDFAHFAKVLPITLHEWRR